MQPAASRPRCGIKQKNETIKTNVKAKKKQAAFLTNCWSKISFLLTFQDVLTGTICHQDYKITNEEQRCGEVAAFLSKNDFKTGKFNGKQTPHSSSFRRRLIGHRVGEAAALTVPAAGGGSWPWRRPAPQRGAGGSRSSSCWGSLQATGWDRQPEGRAARSPSPGSAPRWSEGQQSSKEPTSSTVSMTME